MDPEDHIERDELPSEDEPADEGTYDLEPADQPAPNTGKIDAPSVLEGFDEDEDFDQPPPPEKKKRPKPDTSHRLKKPRIDEWSSKENPEADPLIAPGWGGWKPWAIIGAVLTITAIVVAWVNAETRPIARSLLALYTTLVLTGTGVAAIVLTAMLFDRGVGRIKVGAARMLCAVAAMQIVVHLNIPIAGRLDEWILGLFLLLALIMILLRASRQEALLIGAIQAGLWILLALGNEISAWASKGGGG